MYRHLIDADIVPNGIKGAICKLGQLYGYLN